MYWHIPFKHEAKPFFFFFVYLLLGLFTGLFFVYLLLGYRAGASTMPSMCASRRTTLRSRITVPSNRRDGNTSFWMRFGNFSLFSYICHLKNLAILVTVAGVANFLLSRATLVYFPFQIYTH